MTSSGTARPGGRTARTAQAVFAATLAELAARPYADISIETIAARAGVHKTTVYRRWRAKPDLVVDALSNAADARIEVPDTGSVESDLRALSRAVQATLSSPEGAATTKALCAAALTSPEIAGVLARFWRIRLGAISSFARAATRSRGGTAWRGPRHGARGDPLVDFSLGPGPLIPAGHAPRWEAVVADPVAQCGPVADDAARFEIAVAEQNGHGESPVTNNRLSTYASFSGMSYREIRSPN